MSTITRRAAIAGLAAIPTAAMSADERNPDAGLLLLGEQLDRLWAEENRLYAILEASRTDHDGDLWDAANDRTSAVVDQIEALPASTFAGLQVKARAVSWCYCGDPIYLDDQRTTDIRLTEQILKVLLG